MEFTIGQVFVKVELPQWGQQFYLKVVFPVGSHMVAFRGVLERSKEEIEIVGLIYEKDEPQAIKTVEDW